MKLANTLFLSAATMILSGCGGGGGGSDSSAGGGTVVVDPAQTVVTTYPFRAGYVKRIAAGGSTNYAVTGSCSGSAVVSDTVPAAATFEAMQVLASTNTTTLNVTPTSTAAGAPACPSAAPSSSITYYDSNYNLVGSQVVGANYGVFSGPATALPETLAVGATGRLGTQVIYADASKTAAIGQVVVTYQVSADTNTTAILTLTSSSLNASAAPTGTITQMYRVSAAGDLTPLSIERQSTNPNFPHLVLTAR